MTREFTDHELEAYLDESLAAPETLEIETALRVQPALAERLIAVNRRRDSGQHSVGEIWRRHGLSCATREELGSLLLGVLDADHAGYLTFHVETIGCRICQANLDDLRRQQQEQAVAVRRRKTVFETSAGLLRDGERG